LCQIGDLAWAGQEGHDKRYEIAEDYMQAVYKLWEDSWEDGAVLRDRVGKICRRRPDPSRTPQRPLFSA